MKRPKIQRYERYDFEASPWAQDLTQRDLATLLGTTKDRLEALVRDKDKWIARRIEVIAGKPRNLAVPFGKLRTVHEHIKFHLNKIKQPDYLFSPRKGRGQRDNAEHHAGQNQFLSLDIRQFYPSTTKEHIFRWAHHVAGLREDVAGLLTHLASVDGKMPFGSPISPVLTTHVHRVMFDAIYNICITNGLKMTLWVDDLTISGLMVHGDLVEEIRAVIRKCGFQTHKITFRSGALPVIVTGVPIKRARVMAPRSLHQRVQRGYADLRVDDSDTVRLEAIDRLLSALGTHRYHLGSTSPEGRQTSNRMQALRQRKRKLVMTLVTQPGRGAAGQMVTLSPPGTDLPWE